MKALYFSLDLNQLKMSKIRQATTLDIPHIQNIATTTWPETFAEILSKSQMDYMIHMMYSTDALASQIQGDEITFWLATTDKAIKGFMAFQPHHPSELQIKIHKLYILPSAQRKGIGQELIKKLVAFGIAGNFKNITLNVNKYNHSATNFYKRQGFDIIKEEVIPIGEGYIMDDYVLLKTL
jgi:ribosomal protein S18 acetylase RimI-like enzyme